MALLPTKSSRNEGFGGSELRGHISRGSWPAQFSTRSSNHDAGYSPSKNYYYPATGEVGPGLGAPTGEDANMNLVDLVQSPTDTTVSRGASAVPYLGWDREPVLVAGSQDAFEKPDPLEENLTNHNGASNHIDQIDHHIHFITKVRKIRQQRQKVQGLRIRVRDGRTRMKHTRNRLQNVFRNFLEAGGTIPPQGNSHGGATAGLQEVVATFKELEAQDIDLDMVESTLVPAEWELKESEQQLYEDILGSSASDRHGSEISVQLLTRITESLHDGTNQNDVDVSLAPTYEPTSQGQLSALAWKRQEVMDRLLGLTKEYNALQEDVQMRQAADIPVDEFSQEALEAFPRRRAQLMRELADLTTDINTLNDVIDEGPDLMSKESDALFGHNQFDHLPTTEVTSQQCQTEGDEVLHLHPCDYEERYHDILPFLSQPILNTMSQAQGLEEQLPVPLPVQYSSVAWDLSGQDAESISVFVSMWILGCVQSSWWSLIRFIFMTGLDGIISIKTVEDFVKTTWFQGDLDHAPETYFSEDPESSGFPVTYEDAVFTPLSGGTTNNQEFQWESRPLTRRHSSGYMAGTVHRKLSNHTYPKPGCRSGG